MPTNLVLGSINNYNSIIVSDLRRKCFRYKDSKYIYIACESLAIALLVSRLRTRRVERNGPNVPTTDDEQ